MFGKLNAKAPIGTAVESNDETFDDEASPEVHVSQFGNNLRFQILSEIQRRG